MTWPDMSSNERLSDHQKAVISGAMQHNFWILGGGPGTGKTFALAEIVKELLGQCGADQVGLASPTGKASVTFTESLSLPGMRARTIHSMLGVQSSTAGDGWGFTHGRDYPLPFQFVIIDEASMVDTSLAASLMRARERGTHMLWCGDVHQLAPVGHGAPLRDMISAKVPYAELTEVRRNSGEIVEQCRMMREEGRIQIRSVINASLEHLNFALYEAYSPERQINRMLEAINHAANVGLNTTWDVQVLTPTNKSGDLGRKNLNQILQKQLNPNPEVKGSPFRLGDKVVCLKNSWFRLLNDSDDDCPTNDKGEAYVANGDIGCVTECEPKFMEIELKSPYRLVAVGRGQAKASGHENDADTTNKQDEDAGTGCAWDLAYALSVHKCVHPETIVETDQGLLPIRSINQSGCIAAEKTPWRYDHKVFYEETDALKIETENGFSVTVSVDHLCEIWSGSEWGMVTAGHLQVGQWVRQRLGVLVDPFELPILPQPIADVRSVNYTYPSRMNGDLAEFLGLAVADVCVFRAGVRFVKAQKETVERFMELAKSLFGIESCAVFTPGKKTGWWTTELLSTELRNWLQQIGGLSPNAKNVPDCILRSSADIHARFLRGLFEDGSVHIRGDKLDHINLCLSSPEIISVVRVMLLRLGVASSCNSQKRNKSSLYIYSYFAKVFEKKVGFISHEKCRRLSLPQFGNGESSRFRVPIDVDLLKAKSAELKRKFGTSTIYGNARHRGYISRSIAERAYGIIDSNSDYRSWLYSRITSISETRCPVMCVEVPDVHRFLQNGFSWGNSQGSETPVAIVMLDDGGGARRVCDRSWLYTAISRAKRYCVAIGREETAQGMVRRNKIDQRRTFLAELIEAELIRS